MTYNVVTFRSVAERREYEHRKRAADEAAERRRVINENLMAAANLRANYFGDT